MADSIGNWMENLHATLDAVGAPREESTSGRISMLAGQRESAVSEARRLRCERDRLRYLLSESANMADNAVSHAYNAGNYELAEQYAKRRDEYRTASTSRADGRREGGSSA